MPIVKVSKPDASSLLGIDFCMTEMGTARLTKVYPGSLLTDKVSPQQEIVTVNGTQLFGMTMGQVKALLKSCTGDVELEIRDAQPSYMLAIETNATLSSLGDSGYRMIYHLSLSDAARNAVPSFLTKHATQPLSLSKWQSIYDSFRTLLPIFQETHSRARSIEREMGSYAGKQKFREGTWLEAVHERKVLRIVHSFAAASHNLTLMTTNVLATVNAILIGTELYARLAFDPSHNTNGNQNPETDILTLVGMEFLSLRGNPMVFMTPRTT